jgi:2-haloacid dehalogenase
VPIKHVLFDLNGTLFDPVAIAEPLGDQVSAGTLVDEILGDAVLFAMAETLSGGYRDFSELLRAAAARRLALAGEPDRVEDIVSAAGRMEPFPEAEAAIESLRSAGIGAGVLTNSSTATAKALVAGAGLDLEPVVGTDQIRAFKPDPRVYARGVEAVGASPAEVALITAHGWDALGAKRAGLTAVWISRKERVAIGLDQAVGVQAADLVGAAEWIAAA